MSACACRCSETAVGADFCVVCSKPTDMGCACCGAAFCCDACKDAHPKTHKAIASLAHEDPNYVGANFGTDTDTIIQSRSPIRSSTWVGAKDLMERIDKQGVFVYGVQRNEIPNLSKLLSKVTGTSLVVPTFSTKTRAPALYLISDVKFFSEKYLTEPDVVFAKAVEYLSQHEDKLVKQAVAKAKELGWSDPLKQAQEEKKKKKKSSSLKFWKK